MPKSGYCTDHKTVKKRQLNKQTIRFRKWSRKAYAAFASLGRCVTIGCLPKSVADSSLSKQKAGMTTGCQSSGRGTKETENVKGKETDIGVPLGSENGLGRVPGILGFGGVQIVCCPANAGHAEKKYNDITRKKYILNKSITRMTRTMQGLFSDLYYPRHSRYIFSTSDRKGYVII